MSVGNFWGEKLVFLAFHKKESLRERESLILTRQMDSNVHHFVDKYKYILKKKEKEGWYFRYGNESDKKEIPDLAEAVMVATLGDLLQNRNHSFFYL